MEYKIPDEVRIGHVHLKVSDIEKSLGFYCGLLGFKLMMRMGKDAAFISAGGYHHHIGLNTWYSRNAGPAPQNVPGLFHTAILFPDRKSLAVAVKRLIDSKYPISGASDHGVSEAIYLDDPDNNGIELYYDRPRDQWPYDNGEITMYTRALDLKGLLEEIENPEKEKK